MNKMIKNALGVDFNVLDGPVQQQRALDAFNQVTGHNLTLHDLLAASPWSSTVEKVSWMTSVEGEPQAFGKTSIEVPERTSMIAHFHAYRMHVGSGRNFEESQNKTPDDHKDDLSNLEALETKLKKSSKMEI